VIDAPIGVIATLIKASLLYTRVTERHLLPVAYFLSKAHSMKMSTRVFPADAIQANAPMARLLQNGRN
jgi:hypothetical protein